MTQDLISKFGSSARGAEYNFLPAVLYAHEQFAQKNNKPMYALIALVNGKKFKGFKSVEVDGEPVRLTQFAGPLRRILARTLSNVQFVYKDGQARVKVGPNGGVNGDVVEELKAELALWNNKLTVRGDWFKSTFPPVKKDKPAADKVQQKKKLDAYLKRFADEYDMTVEQVILLAQSRASDVAATQEPDF